MKYEWSLCRVYVESALSLHRLCVEILQDVCAEVQSLGRVWAESAVCAECKRSVQSLCEVCPESTQTLCEVCVKVYRVCAEY